MFRLLVSLLALWAILPLSVRANAAGENSLSCKAVTATVAADSAVRGFPIIGASAMRRTAETPLRVSRHSNYYGVGFNHLFDSYLSPLDYTGPTLVYTHQRERDAAWAGREKTSMTIFTGNATLAENPAGNGEYWDADFQWGYGLHHNWLWGSREQPTLRLALGGLWGIHAGGTYSTRNGNNPAQLRLATDLSASALAEYRFPLWQRQWWWRTQLDLPLLGVMFSPRFGESYYEMLSVAAHPRFAATYSVNAPSLRLLSTLTLPLKHRRLSVGCQIHVRQSQVHDLKRHAWNVALVVGYTRTLNFLD